MDGEVFRDLARRTGQTESGLIRLSIVRVELDPHEPIAVFLVPFFFLLFLSFFFPFHYFV